MVQIILDFGSGNTCQNKWTIAKRMIDELSAVDSKKHEVVIKWQLFEKAGNNVPLDREIFKKAHNYASELGYKTTASVFDVPSLEYLLQFNVPFIKIANNREARSLIGETPRKVLVYASYGDIEDCKLAAKENVRRLLCVSEYPASVEAYSANFDLDLYVGHWGYGLSDHTETFDLFSRHKPEIIEWHFKLKDSKGLDAGKFARTPNQLKEAL